MVNAREEASGVEDRALGLCFAASGLLHLLAGAVLAVTMTNSARRSEYDLVAVELLEAPLAEETKPAPALMTSPQVVKSSPQPIRQPAPLPRDLPKAEETRPNAEELRPKAEELQPKKDEAEKAPASSLPPGGGAGIQSAVRDAPGKGSGVGKPSDSGDVAVVPGEGLGRSGTGSGAAPPGPGTGQGGSRAAKPVQTAKASYPPMALRMGLEADVTLKLFVDADGKVAKVEVTTSAGMGFDEEALKVVRQFRFEAAISDEKRVPSEFTYTYRFRLER